MARKKKEEKVVKCWNRKCDLFNEQKPDNCGDEAVPPESTVESCADFTAEDAPVVPEDSGEGEGEGITKAPCDTCPDHAEGCGSADDQEDCIEAINTVVIETTPNYSDIFKHPLPVFLSQVELGKYSEEQARLFQHLLSLREAKKASNKHYGDQIKDTEKKLDEMSQIVEEGTEERPVECRWFYDYSRCEKVMMRLDTMAEVQRQTMTKEEMQMDLPGLAEKSIAAVNEAFRRNEEVRDSESEDSANGLQAADDSADLPNTEVAATEDLPVTEPLSASAEICTEIPPKTTDGKCNGCGSCGKTYPEDDTWPDPPAAA